VKIGEAQAAAFTRFDAELLKIKQRSARLPGGGDGDGEAPPLSLGQRIVESKEYKAVDLTSGRASLKMTLPGKLRTKAVTITEAGSGYGFVPQRVGMFQTVPDQPLIMRDLITSVPISGTNAIEYVYETWNLAADYQLLEGDKKAQSDVTYTDDTAMVRTIAHFVKISRQMAADAPFVMANVDERLTYGVKKKEEQELLFGDGLTGHLKGLMTWATALPVGPLPGLTIRTDELAAAIAYLANLGYAPTAQILNPLDWATMQIQKTTLGTYILGGPPTSFASGTMWGLPLLTTPAMVRDNFLVGRFPGTCAIFDREQVTVEIATENEDDFVRNLLTIRCEERIAFACFVPQAFVKGPFVQPFAPIGAVADAPQSARKNEK